MEKYIPCKWEAKKPEVEILISDKIDLKIKITRDKERHYIKEEDIAIVISMHPTEEHLIS